MLALGLTLFIIIVSLFANKDSPVRDPERYIQDTIQDYCKVSPLNPMQIEHKVRDAAKYYDNDYYNILKFIYD